MATRSRIAIEFEPGLFLSVYCHWDGYPSNNGKILLDHYNDKHKVLLLMSLGDMSILGPNIGTKHSFDDRNGENQCTFYGRDRGEKETEAIRGNNLYDLPTEEYNYLFALDGKWYFSSENTGPQNYVLLTTKDCVD